MVHEDDDRPTSPFTSPYRTFDGGQKSPKFSALVDAEGADTANRGRANSAPNVLPEPFTPSIFSELSRRTPLVLLLWIFCLCVGTGLTTALQPPLLQRLFAAKFAGVPFNDITCPTDTTDPHCLRGLAYAGQISTYFSGGSSVITMVMSPFAGRLSDRIGIKPILLLSSFLGVPTAWCLYSVVTSAQTGTVQTSISYLYAYMTASSFSGSWFLAVVLGAFSEACSPGNRAASFAIVLGFFELAFILGPKGGVILSTHYGISMPFFLAFMITVASTSFLCFLPGKKASSAVEKRNASSPPKLPSPDLGSRKQRLNETSTFLLQEEAESKDEDRPRSALSVFLDDFLYSLRILNRSSFFRVLATIAVCQNAVSSGLQTLFSYIARDGFDFSPNDCANQLLVLCLSSLVAQFFLIKPILGCAGERGLLLIGLLAGVLGPLNNGIILTLFKNEQISFPVSRTLLFISTGAVQSCALFVFPAVSALKANNVGNDEQGATQGALYAAKSVSGALAPFLFGALFNAFSKTPEVLYFMSVGIGLLALSAMWCLPSKTSMEDEKKAQAQSYSLLKEP